MTGRFFGGGTAVTPHERVRDFARVQVRAGLLAPEALHAEVEAAVVAELPGAHAANTARTLIDEARAVLLDEQGAWPTPTDHSRLQDAFAALEHRGVRVLQAVDDHWLADTELRQLAARDALPTGCVWFTPPDVWHAVDHGMLELNVWHPDTANVAPGDSLLGLVLDTLAAHGLDGHFDEGRVELAASWRKPLPPA